MLTPSTNCSCRYPWLRWLWLAAALAAPAAAEPIAPAEPIKLFDGRSFAPFYTFVQGRGRDTDPKGVFQVVDGMLRISGEEWGCVTTREEYRDYRLVVEYRWGDETFGKRAAAARDSGLLLHSRGQDGGYGGVWMHGIEAQIIEGGTGDLLVVGDGSDEFALTATVAAEPQGKAKVYAPDGRPITIHGGRIDWWGRDSSWKDTLGFRGARDAERPVGEWNTLECVARGDTLEVSLNGVVVSRATGLKPAAGRIQIQSEGAEVFFRRVELLPLEPAKAPAAKAAAAAEPPAPAEVAAATELPADFALELAAAEPAVVDPVAITFDERGRPYIVEYRDYPQGPPPGQPALSRIVRLDDADGDGFYEGSTVVAEHVPFAQGVLAVRGGLLVTAAPDVLMLTDTDGDGRADRREVVATGFKTGNPQLRAACPQLDIDNTVSITGGLSGGVVHRPDQPAKEGVSIDRRDVRIDLARNRIEAAAGFGQFGNAFDDLGRRFTTSNRNPVIAVRLPAAALARNPYVDLGGGYEDAAPSGAASRVFPIVETQATAASHTGTHTSACGLTIFRGDALGPDAVGDAFICEPVSHLVTRRRLRPAGACFTSDHVGLGDREFLASRSPWFRPVFTATGPDGSLWVVDMCRSTVEHPEYMPPGLADTLDLRAGDRAGRIWRITRKGSAPRGWTPPTTAAEAAALFADPNGWRRSTAQRLLVEGRFKDAAPAVRAALAAALAAPASSAKPLAAVHALWTLQGLGALTADDVRAAAGATQAGVRETAARLAPLVDADGLAAEIAERLVNDADAGVRLAATLAAA
ncbi:MAG: PVC-type heme-binding CxxCH protein, partial [Planctomycetota bacterium]